MKNLNLKTALLKSVSWCNSSLASPTVSPVYACLHLQNNLYVIHMEMTPSLNTFTVFYSEYNISYKRRLLPL